MYEARLTFDDGPGRSTPEILAVLERFGVQGIFFVIGERVQEHAALVRRAVGAGHLIGNHSWDHTRLTMLGAADIESQLMRTNAAIADATGNVPALFRPPFGDRDERVDAIAAKLGLTIMMWDVDSEDWRQPGVEPIAQAVSAARAGQVVLLHDGGKTGREQTVAGLKTGLARWAMAST